MSSNDGSNSSDPLQIEKLRDELRVNKTRLNNVLNPLPEGIIVIDSQGAILLSNPAALKLISQPLEIFLRDYPWREGVGKIINHEVKIGGSQTALEIEVLETEWDSKTAYVILIRDLTRAKEKELSLQQAIDDAEARTAQLEIMRFVADQLNQAAMLEETIQSGLEMIQALSGAKKVWALLADETNMLHLVVVDNQVKDKTVHKTLLDIPGNCTCLKMLQNGELNEVKRITHCEWTRHIFGEQYADIEHLSFPLSTGAKSVGVLNLSVDADKEYSQNDLSLLETISHELAVAIERSRMLSETSEALHRDEEVNSITRSLSTALDLTTILQNVVRLSSDLIGAEIGILSLLSPDQKMLSFPFHFGLPADMELAPIQEQPCLVWDAVHSCGSHLDSEPKGQLPELPPDIAEKVNSTLSVPIIGRDRCLGVLTLYKTSRERYFSKFDLAMLESLGRQAGLAIINAELYFEVQQLTTSDPLTGINNRLSFNNLAVKEVERSWRYGRPLAIVLADIDSLRVYSETYGNEAGNEAIKELARVLTAGLRRVDLVGRYQYDEIVFLLPETDIKNAIDVAERLRLQVATTPMQTQDGSAAITVSMGVTAIEGRQEIDLQTLLDRAESALFDAKQAGRNRVAIWRVE